MSTGRGAPAPDPGRATVAGVAAEDWDLLFDAVLWRLARGGVAVVPSCLRALRQLQVALAQERGLQRRLRRELRDTHAALAAARRELLLQPQTGAADADGRRLFGAAQTVSTR